MQSDQAMFALNFLLPQIKNESKTTRRVIDAIPADKSDYRPDPKAKTALELAWHLVSADVWFLDSVANGEFGPGNQAMPSEIKTPSDIARWYDQHVAEGVDRLSKATPEQLSKVLNFFNVFNHPAVFYLGFMMNHSIHHRGQLSTYLRPMGGKVPSIYGGSADEPFEMPQQAVTA